MYKAVCMKVGTPIERISGRPNRPGSSVQNSDTSATFSQSQPGTKQSRNANVRNFFHIIYLRIPIFNTFHTIQTAIIYYGYVHTAGKVSQIGFSHQI